MREDIETLDRCLNSSAMNATNHVKSEHDVVDDEEKVEKEEKRDYLTLDDYDCIGFDLDHTLCRYNIGPMIRWDINLSQRTKFTAHEKYIFSLTVSIFSNILFRFEYDLLAKFLIEKRGYDEAIKVQSFDSEVDFVCKVNTVFGAKSSVQLRKKC